MGGPPRAWRMVKRGSCSSPFRRPSPSGCNGLPNVPTRCGVSDTAARNARGGTHGRRSSGDWMATSIPLADTGRRALARNAAYNLIGQALPLAVGVVAIPIATRYLGAERFGVLGLVWALIGSFGLLDLGLGRATTQYVAASLARNDHIPLGPVATLSVLVQTILGLLGGAVLALLTPWLVARAI